MAARKKTNSKKSIEDEALEIIQNAPTKRPSANKRRATQSSKKASKDAASDIVQNEPAKKTKRTTSGRKTSRRSASRKGSSIMFWCKIAAAAVLLLSAACMILFDVSRVTSNAMMPTLARNDLVISWAPVWGNINAAPGNIVLIDNDESDSAPNYLRLIADNSEEITYHSDKISVNGIPIKRLQLTNDAIVRPDTEPEIWRETLQNGANYHIMLPQHAILGKLNGSIRAQDGAFLAGDNRMASYDSRQNGLFELQKLKGRAIFVLESSRNDGLIASWFKWID